MFWGLVGGVDVGVWFYFLLYLAMMVSASWRWLSLMGVGLILWGGDGYFQIVRARGRVFDKLAVTLQLVYSDDIDYTYKSTDREALNRLFACRGERDDILIVRRGLLTDTSIANIALFDGKDWFTPKLPLLRGTCRTALIDNGIIKEKDIRPEELSSYSFVRLFNAMIKWGALEFSTGTIYG